MSENDVFGHDDLRRLDEIANRTLDELDEIPTAPPEMEVLIKAMFAAAERVSDLAYRLLNPEEFGSELAEYDL